MTQHSILKTLAIHSVFLAFVLVTGTTDILFLNFAAKSVEAPALSQQPDFVKQRTEIRLSPSVTGKRMVPFGVFDVQSGHGHGQWRDRPENLLR